MANERQRKVLRVALFRQGVLLDEIVLKSKRIRVGNSILKQENTLRDPLEPGLPKSIDLFREEEGEYYLTATPLLRGALHLDGRDSLFEEVVQKQAGKDGEIRLDRSSYGSLTFANAPNHKILFTFIIPPKEVAPWIWSERLKGGVISDLQANKLLLLSVILSLIGQGGLMAFILLHEWPKPAASEFVIPDRFVSLLMDEKPTKPAKDTEESGAEDGGAEEEEEQAEVEEPKEVEEPGGGDGGGVEPLEEAVRREKVEAVRKKTVLGALTAIVEGGGGGGIVDTLTGGASTVSMEEAFAGSSGITRGAAGDGDEDGLTTGGGAGEGGSGVAVGIGDLGGASKGAKAAEGGVATNARKKERKVRAKVKAQPEKVFGGSLDGAVISKTIARRMVRIQKCYERELKRNPLAKGKVVVQFTIGAVGRVTEAKSTVDTVGGGVGTCVAQEIQRMRFPKPDNGGTATVNKSFVFESS